MNIPRGERGGRDCIIVLPRFVQDIVDARFDIRSDKAPNLTIGQWLAAQPAAVERRERFRVLQKYGLSTYRRAKRGGRDAEG